MIKNLLLIATLFIGFNVFAENDHSEDVCSTADAAVCAHLGHMRKNPTSGEYQFVAHVMVAQQVTDMKVELWIPSMGHGSSPVTVQQFGLNKYKVSQAYFIIPGQWEVRLSFSLDGVAHQLNIPVAVEQ